GAEPQAPPPVAAPAARPINYLPLVFALSAVPVLGICAVLAIYGVRRYILNAKTAEAREELTRIGRAAVNVYAQTHRICPSASRPVPANPAAISGRKYQSNASEWYQDGSLGPNLVLRGPVDPTTFRQQTGFGAGFACLGFEMHRVQYFQYDYHATRTD